MTRLFVLGLLLVILWLALKNFKLQLKASLGLRPLRPAPPAPQAETLVRCARCGTYIAASHALKEAGEEVFCSEACLSLGPSGPSKP